MMGMNKTGHGGMKRMGGHHMWMYFHTALDDTVLFEFWTVNSIGGMIVSCVILFFAGVGFEALKWSRLTIENRCRRQQNPLNVLSPANGSFNPHDSISASLANRYRKQLFSVAHLIQTLLFSIQVFWGYLLMLVFMTYSVWLGLAVVLGAATGFYLFSGPFHLNMAGIGQPLATTQQASSSREHMSTGMHGCA